MRVTTNTRWLITAAALTGFAVCVGLFVWSFGPRGNEDVHRQVKQEFSSFVPPPDAVSVQDNDIFNSGGVLVGAYYTTNLPFSEVRQHYEQQMKQTGYKYGDLKQLKSWGKDYGEEMLYYCKGDLMAAVYNPGTIPMKTKYQFSFSISSNAFECR